MAPRSPLPLNLPPNPVAGHTPEKEGPTPDAATHWLSLSERGWLNSRVRRGLAPLALGEETSSFHTRSDGWSVRWNFWASRNHLWVLLIRDYRHVRLRMDCYPRRVQFPFRSQISY